MDGNATLAFKIKKRGACKFRLIVSFDRFENSRLLMRPCMGLWLLGPWDGVHSVDVRVTDTDASSYQARDPASVLKSQEKEKKRKYLAACLEQRLHFTPFLVSTDGLMGREASTFAKCLSAKLTKKWQKPYSQGYGYVNV
jgi:hypothetical protein